MSVLLQVYDLVIAETPASCYLDLLGSRVATRPGSVRVPGEAVDVSREVTGDSRVLVPVPRPAHLLPLLKYLVTLQANVAQFLGSDIVLGGRLNGFPFR